MTISNAISICLKEGIKCYIIRSKPSKFYIEVNDNGKVTRFRKSLENNREANTSLQKTYKYYAKSIKDDN